MFNIIYKNYKPFIFITIIILLIAGGSILTNIINGKEFLKRDIELKGGKLITISGNGDIKELEEAFPEANVRIITGLENSIIIETDENADEEAIINKIREMGIEGEYSVQSVGPALSDIFWSQTQTAIIIAFIAMGILIFILFRSVVPSSAVILAAATDMIVTMWIMGLAQIEFSLASLGALMMLIGYSVDTDVLLTSELTRRKEKDMRERVKSAMKTGMTMTLTTLCVIIVVYFITNSIVIKDIVLVLIIGLSIDLPSTWWTNTGILRWWLDKNEKSD